MNARIDDAEFKTIYDSYGSLVFSRCRKILGSEDEAWDATQEVFIKLMKNLSKIEKRGSLLSWLYSVSTHYCISELRKKRGIGFDEMVHSEDRDAENQRQKALKEITTKLMSPFKKKVREVVCYTYIDGYTHPEISKIMGIGESTIRRYLTDFRRKSAMLNPQF